MAATATARRGAGTEGGRSSTAPSRAMDRRRVPRAADLSSEDDGESNVRTPPLTWPSASLPPTATRRPASTRGWSDRSRSRADGRCRPALFGGRLDRPRRADARPSPRRLRDLDLHRPGGASYTFGPTGVEHGFDAAAGRLRLHPGRRDPRRGECLGHRAAGRRPDPQLSRICTSSTSTAARTARDDVPAPC